MVRLATTVTLALLLVSGCADQQAHGRDRVKATPQALAAIAVEHTDIEPNSIEGTTEESISAGIRFGEDDHLLRVSASENDQDPDSDPCGVSTDRGTCEVMSTADGKVLLYWEDEEPEEDPGIIIVAYRNGDSTNSAYYAGDAVTSDPRNLELSVSVESMIAIVTDDRFGLNTTKELAQSRVSGYTEGPAAVTELSPQVIASKLTKAYLHSQEQSAYEVDAPQYGDGTIGAGVEFADGATVTGYYVLDSDRAADCPPRWRCTKADSGTILRAEQGNELKAVWNQSPVGYQSVFLNEDGSAGVVVWRGPVPQYGLPRFEVDLIASLMGETDTEDQEDVAEIEAIWEER